MTSFKTVARNALRLEFEQLVVDSIKRAMAQIGMHEAKIGFEQSAIKKIEADIEDLNAASPDTYYVAGGDHGNSRCLVKK